MLPTMKRLLLVVLVCLTTGGTAWAHTRLVLPGGSTPQPEQRWINGAKVPTPDVTLTLHRVTCPDESANGGCVDSADIWVDPTVCRASEPGTTCQDVLLHELGHEADAHGIGKHAVVVLGADLIESGLPMWVRYRFMALAHVPQVAAGAWPTWLGLGATLDSGAEQWAEAYRWCAEGRRPTSRHGDEYYGYEPDDHPVMQRRVCALIRSL